MRFNVAGLTGFPQRGEWKNQLAGQIMPVWQEEKQATKRACLSQQISWRGAFRGCDARRSDLQS